VRSERSEPRSEIEKHRDAALIHECLLSVGGSVRWAPAEDLLVALLELHQPYHPPVDSMFATQHGQPICRGCDRAELSPTRDPAWPCRTYRTIAAHLGLVETAIPEPMAAVLVHLDEHRSHAGRGPVVARHRYTRPVDSRSRTGGSPGMQLVRTDDGETGRG
jgi:hypothetical protein